MTLYNYYNYYTTVTMPHYARHAISRKSLRATTPISIKSWNLITPFENSFLCSKNFYKVVAIKQQQEYHDDQYVENIISFGLLNAVL